MKFQPSPVMLSLALAVLYSGALSLLVDAPCSAQSATALNAQALHPAPLTEAPVARATSATLRLRMTLPYVPQNLPRTREQQEI